MATDTIDRLDAESLREVWYALSDEERVDGFRLLPAGESRDFFDGLSSADQAALLLGFSAAEAGVWMRVLAPDDAADLLQQLPAENRERFEGLLDDATRRETQALLAYAEDEAGGLMNPRFARVRPDVTVDVAIRYLRRQTQSDLATFYYAYVLGNDQKLLGVISFRELFSARGERLVADVMRREVVSVQEDADQETVARVFAEQDLTAVPVVDADGRMRGVITVDDVVDVVQEEATEDIQKLGGSEALGAPYLNVGFAEMMRKRGGWLSVLFLGQMLTATVMTAFEHELQQAVILAMFIPLIISSGGNTGSQAATMIVRSLALRELRLGDWLRVFGRELRSGLALGAWLGAFGFARVLLWQQAGWYDYGPHVLLIAVTVWVSVVGVVSFGTLMGSMLPFIMRRVGFDPAASSVPFVATLVDVTGLAIYFGVAAAVLRGTLL